MINYIKENNSRFFKMFLSLMMIFTLIAQSISGVNAKTVVMDRDTALSSYMSVKEHTDNLGANHPSGGKRVFKIDGKYAYCIESDVDISADREYSNGNNPEEVLKNGRRNILTTWFEKYNMISAILTMIPSSIDSDTKSEHIKWLVGQTMMWEITGEERDWDFTYNGPTRSGAMAYRDTFIWDYSADEQAFNNFYNEVEQKMLLYWKVPSFTARKEASSQTYTLDKFDGTNYYTTLPDTNGVLSNFDFNANGFSFTKDGNQLTVKTSNSNNDTVTIKTKPSSSFKMRSPIFWTDGNAQKTVTCGDVEDPSPFAYFKTKIGTGNVEIGKKDNKGNFIPGTTFKLSYNADMSSPIGSYTTGVNGKTTINDLYNRTLYIQETAVPNNLILDSTVKSIAIENGTTTTYTATNQWKQGYVRIGKIDNKTSQIVKKAGTQFEILSAGIVVSTITTDSSGYAKSGLLDYGTYTLREKLAPGGYTGTSTTQTANVVENGKTYEFTFNNDPVTGEINLLKQDKETGNIAQGDATLENATYVLKANANILNPADGSILFNAGDIISSKAVGTSTWGDTGTKKTDKQHKIKWSNLPLGNYIIEETDPSTGYLLDTQKYTVNLTYTNQNQTVATNSTTSTEQIIKGKTQIAKSGDPGSTGVIQGLKDVEFTFKLHSEVLKLGWDNAKTYDIITTGENGIATTTDLPFGLYLVRETKTPPNYNVAGDFFVNIDQDGEIEYRIINNMPFQAYLKIIKTDQNDKTVTLSKASFKLKDSSGNFVKQKIGDQYIDTFVTNEKGYVQLPKQLVQGKYTITELKAPNGMLLGKDIIVDISSTNPNINLDEDNDAVITVKFENSKPTGNIVFNKNFELSKDQGVGGVTFRLTANSDIVDPTNGKIIYQKGDVVNIDIAEDGLYILSESGVLEISGLPLGTDKVSYKLEEVKALDGYKLLDSPIIFDFEIKDNTTKEYTVEKSATNYLTETSFIKQSINGSVVPGAKYKLIDSKNHVIDQWTTSKDKHIIKGLIYGQEYTLIEEEAPLGYTIAKDIKFTYNENTKEIVMKDTRVSISKQDINDKDLIGAKLQIISNKTKQIVDEWISDGSNHYISNLIVGQEYILREIEPPKGYLKAEDISFTVLADENQSIVMIDKQILTTIQVNKVDSLTKLAIISKDFEFTMYADPECTKVLAVVNANQENGNAIFENVAFGQTVYIKETKAPEGYMLSDEIKKIVVDENLDGIGDVHSFIYENTLLPIIVTTTSDNTNVAFFVSLTTVSLLCSYTVTYFKRNKEEE